MYRLKRDDGAELQVTGSAWEAALELASLYGWKPAGTETPETQAWLRPDSQRRTPAWDRMDYFSYESQRVGGRDAQAFAESVLRALAQIPDRESCDEDAPGADVQLSSPLPSRRSAVAEGMSAPRRRLLHRLAAFADRGGFRIGSSA